MRIDKLRIYEEEFPHILLYKNSFFPWIRFAVISPLYYDISPTFCNEYIPTYIIFNRVFCARNYCCLIRRESVTYMDNLFCLYVSRLQISISTSRVKECGNDIPWIIFSRLKAPPFHEFLKENMALEVIKTRHASACKSSELFLRGLFGRGLISRSRKQIFAYLRVPRSFSKDVES